MPPRLLPEVNDIDLDELLSLYVKAKYVRELEEISLQNAICKSFGE